MRWNDVQSNWSAFHAPILQRWPEADENRLINIAGEERAFQHYIASLTGQDQAAVRDDIATFLQGEMPADVITDPHHDNASITDAGDYVPAGEDPSDDDARFGDDNKTQNPVGRT